MPMIFPRPPHSGHAPSGLLKLNRYSSGSRNVIPSSSNLEQNAFRFPSSTMDMSPSPLSNAVCTDDSSRVRRSSRWPIRSAMTTPSFPA